MSNKEKYQYIHFENNKWRFKGRRATVLDAISGMMDRKDSPDLLAKELDVPLEAVNEAIIFYQENLKEKPLRHVIAGLLMNILICNLLLNHLVDLKYENLKTMELFLIVIFPSLISLGLLWSSIQEIYFYIKNKKS